MDQSKTPRVSNIRLQASHRSRDSSSLSSSSVSLSNDSKHSNAVAPTKPTPYTLAKLKSSPSLPHIKTDFHSREKLHGKNDDSDHVNDVSDDESYTSSTQSKSRSLSTSSEDSEEEYASESFSSGSSGSYAGSSDEFEPPRNKDCAFNSGQVVTALYDYTGSTDAELNFRRGDQFIIVDSNDTNWLYCSVLKDATILGYVPSNYVNVNGSEHKRNTNGEAPLHSPSIYDNVTLNAKMLICGNSTKLSNVEEVADAFAHVPRGCKASTLFRMSLEGGHETSKRMAPRLNADGIGFKDLLVDDKKPKIRRNPVHCTIAFSLLEARHVPIPLPNPGCHITGRHVRISIFDKVSVRSNVLVVPALFNEEVWKFSAKSSLLFPRDDENTCFIRTNEKDFNLCVLFEFCVAFAMDKGVKKDAITMDVATGELGCGWAILPLYTAEGNAIEIRTYEIKLNGGTPFERDMILGDEVAKKGLWETLTNATRTPKINIRLWNLGKSAMNTINVLPEVLISFLSHVPVLAYYRQIQADALLIGKDEEPDLQLKFHPALAAMQVLVDQPDLLRILVRAWEFEVRRARRKEKRSAKIMKQKFCKTVVSIWPLCSILDMPNHVAGDNAIETLRSHFITRYRAEGPVAILASYPCTASHTPFSVQELSARPRLVQVT